MTTNRRSDESPRSGGSPGLGWIGIPETPRLHVSRPRLLDLLDRDDRCSLLLVSGPAGSGKTSLLAEWVATRCADRISWITFESPDEPFWPGLVGCLDRLGVPVSALALPAGGAALDPSARRRLAATLAAEVSRVTIVVDGCDLDAPAVAGDLDYLLRHSGHRLRVLLATRADPVLPLYRYRLEETMTEVRTAELAFTDAEAEELLTLMGVSLRSESLLELNARTKGWVTGLRFAARMLADRDDPDSAVLQVVGSSGNIAEYLMGEVLAAQTPEVRRLLMATSVPDLITPGLAETLAGRSAAHTLALMVRVNVFLESVPERPGSFRYHPFFRDLLRAELAYSAPEEMEELQRKAAQWFAEHDLLTPSVRHFAAIGAWSEATEQVVDKLAVGQLLLAHGTGPLAQSLSELPDDLDAPAATVVRATLALGEGDTDRFNEELARVTSRPEDDAAAHAPAVVLAVALLRAVRARFSEDPDEAATLAEAAEQALGLRANRPRAERHPELAAMVLASKGIAAVRQGRHADAEDVLRAGTGAALDAGTAPLVIECLGYLAALGCFSGSVHRAQSMATRAIGVAEETGISAVDRSASPQVALAWVAVERYDLRAAVEHVRAAERSDFLLGDPVPRTLLALVKARLQVMQGDRAGAIGRLEKEAAAVADHYGWIADRLLAEIAQLQAGFEPEQALLTALDVLERRTSGDAALAVAVAKLRLDDESGARDAVELALARESSLFTRVSAWLLECARHLRAGAPGRAREELVKALKLAAGAQLRRPFHEATPAVRQLLVQDAQLSADHAWVLQVGGKSMSRVPERRPTGGDRAAPAAPVESLTEKELEVLVRLSEMLSTEEIAAAMYISVNTVRTHVRNILRKLGVSRRNAAVRLARDLELIPG
jgi:LuxR family maltose regulon positive regulatory protein